MRGIERRVSGNLLSVVLPLVLAALLCSGLLHRASAQTPDAAGKTWREKLRERFRNDRADDDGERPWRKKLREAIRSRFGVNRQTIGTDDPLPSSGTADVRIKDLTVTDGKRGREIPLRLYLPSGTATAPVVLFSHGLGGSRRACAYLGEHWASRGYVGVFLQHPGSDEEIWRNAPPAQRRSALTNAASGENLRARVGDVHAVLDALARWHNEPGNPLSGRLDLSRVGMSGHSFGAQTTQAVSGQAAGRLGQPGLDTRIRAAILFSPNRPRIGDPAVAFGSVAIPWLLMTGTRDESPIGGATPQTRQQVFPFLPPGGKYQLVLEGAEHAAFTDGNLGFRTGARNPNHHRAILAISTAFWDAWLRDSAEARAWLDGAGPRSVLEGKDRWERK